MWGRTDAIGSVHVPPEGLLSPERGYLGWWRFEEAPGGLAVDWTTGRRHAEVLGEPVPTAGAQGAALLLDGDDDHLLLDPALLEGAEEYTVTVHVRPTTNLEGATRRDFHYRDLVGDPTSASLLLQYDGGHVMFQRASAQGDTEWGGHPTALDAGRWYDIAWTRDEEGVLLALFDGAVRELVWQHNGDPGPALAAAGNWHVGQRPDGTNRFDGAVDEILVMDRALPPETLLGGPAPRPAPGDREVVACVDQDADGWDTCPVGHLADDDGRPADCDDRTDAVHPEVAEVCNGIDDDCSGEVDNGIAPGDACDTGEDGVCAAGTERCRGGRFVCVRDVEPFAGELCNGADDDCNGLTDEGFELGVECRDGVGACEAVGETVCSLDGFEVECDAVPGDPADEEECGNGVDDDCNGAVDDGCVSPVLGPWVETTALPHTSDEVPALAVGGRLYVIAPHERADGRTSKVWVADVLRDGALSPWRETTPYPDAVDGHAVATFGGRVYVAGGTGAGRTLRMARVLAGGSLGAWQATEQLPEGRSNHALVAHAGHLYVIGGAPDGGRGTQVLSAPIAADGTTGAWLPEPPLPEARAGTAAVAFGRYVYVLGGYGPDGQPRRTVFQALVWPDGSLGEWQPAASLLEPVPYRAIGIGDHLFAISRYDGANGDRLVQVARIGGNGDLGAWELAPSFPVPRGGKMGLAAVRGHLYVLGGWYGGDGFGGVVHHAPLAGLALEAGFPLGRPVGLSDSADPDHAGTAAARRTNELIELPLVAGGYLDDSVVGYWPLDGDGTDRAGDAVAVNHGATRTPDRFSREGGALAFDGASHVVTGLVAAPSAEESWTLALWVRVDGGQSSAVFGHHRGAGSENVLRVDTLAPRIQWSFQPQAGQQASVVYGGDLHTDGGWHHLVAVRAAAADRCLLYLDGRLVAAAADVALDFSGGEPAALLGASAGNPGGDPADRLTGALDEVVVLRRALSPAEVRHYYESGRDWGTPLLPGAQPDFDDLLVTADGAPAEFELAGARPLADRAAGLGEHGVGYWSFDEGYAELVTGRQPDELGGALARGRGRFGEAAGGLDQRAAQGYLVYHDQDDFDVPSREFTFEAWVRWTGAGSRDAIVTKEAGGDHEYLFRLWDGRISCVYIPEGQASFVGALSTDPIPGDRWVHVACVRDDALMWLYVDGLPVPWGAEEGRAPVAGPLRNSAGPLCVGAQNRDSFRWRGQLDEVVVHDVARSADYVYKRAHPLPRVRFLADTAAAPRGDGRFPYADYRLHWGAPDAAAPASRVDDLLGLRNGFVAWWRFEEGPGPLVVDSSANRLHGTFVRGGWTPGPGDPVSLDTEGTMTFRVPTAEVLDATESLTVEVRAQRTADARQNVVWKHSANLVGGWSFVAQPGHAAALIRQDQVGQPMATRSRTAQPWPEGRFVHVAATAAPAGHPLGGVRTYLDGEPDCEGGCPRPAAPAGGFANDAQLYVSGEPGGGPGLPGLLDEVRIMNRPLEPHELVLAPPSTGSAGVLEDARCGGAVPAGWVCVPPTGPEGFLMGSPPGELGRAEALDMDPHPVVITRPFLVARTEVTQGRWSRLMGGNPSSYGGCGDTCPVNGTGWVGAIEYANALSRDEGLEECYVVDGADSAWPRGLDCQGYRLPTEAEWEYATRAGTGTAYSSGPNLYGGAACEADANLEPYGWYCANALADYEGCVNHVNYPGCLGVQPVASKLPNPWGLYDVHGNLGEWVWDRWGLGSEAAVDPTGPPEGQGEDSRVFKGQAVTEPASKMRSATRSRDGVEVGGYGFRLVRTACVPERCNGRDDDCDGQVDEGLPWCGAEPPRHREVGLSDDAEEAHAGTSARRRTSELIELPLVAGGYLDDSVIGYWPLDEDAPDRNERPGGALHFDGQSDELELPEGPSGTGSFTVSLWLRTEASANNYALSRDAQTGTQPGIVVATTGPVSLYVGDPGQGGQSYHRLESTTQVSDGAWHHVVGVRDVRAATISLYVDGHLEAVHTSATAWDVGAGPVKLGRSQSIEGNGHGVAMWDGDLDEVVFLSRALSPLEVRHYHASGADWGTRLLPGAQPDFDDLLVTEDGEPAEFELVGARPLADRAGDLDEHVLAYWPLDGDGVDLARPGSPAAGEIAGWIAGRFGRATGSAELTGAAHSLTAPHVAGVGESGRFTIEVWVLPYGGVGHNNLLLRQGLNPIQLSLDLKSGSLRPRFDIGPSDGTTSVLAPDSLPVGRWSHVAVSYDGETIRMYVDGLEVASGALGAVPATDADVVIGRYLDAGHLEGRLDDVVIHDVARSADYLYKRAHPLPRVRFLADTAADPDGGRFPYRAYRLSWGLPDHPAPPNRVDDLLSPRNGVLAWWRFEEASGTTAVDWSVARLHGEAAGGPAPTGGALGAALRFDGVQDQNVRIDERERLAVGDDLTVELLLRADRADVGQTLVSDDANPSVYVQWGHPDHATAKLGCRLPNGAGFVHGQTDLEADRWLSLACTAGGGRLEAFLNQQSDGVDPNRNAELTPAATTLTIGSYRDGREPFDGIIDEVRLTGRVLLPHELLPTVPTAWSLGPLRDDHCGGVPCPEHPLGWPAACNGRGHCEYTPAEDPLAAEIWVPPGVCPMGSPDDEEPREADEDPVYDVTFAEGFWIGKHEATVAQYQACRAVDVCGDPSVVDWPGRNGLNTVADGESDHPQNGLKWQQAVDYCAWRELRLPSEAEWEYAAKGPEHRKYPWGDLPEPTCGNGTAVFNEDGGEPGFGCGDGGTAPVGSRPAGASWAGALHMAGNVCEWVGDCWHGSYADDGTRPEDGSAWTESCSGDFRLTRGGCYSHAPDRLRAADRDRSLPGSRYANFGVRCLRPSP